MPIYEYQCAECGETFDLFLRSVNEEKAPTCPKCGSSQVEKAISLFGVGGTSGSSRASSTACGPTAST